MNTVALFLNFPREEEYFFRKIDFCDICYAMFLAFYLSMLRSILTGCMVVMFRSFK